MKLLVTGFGPFGPHETNPSQILAEGSGHPSHILPVSYAEVDEFLDRDPMAGFDAWLMIGVHGKATRQLAELVARNNVGTTPDITGRIAGPGPIDSRLPAQVHGPLWSGVLEGDFEFSTNAGSYLCNYLYFRALVTYPERSLGFLHIPTTENLPLDYQRAGLQEIIERLSAQQALGVVE